MFNLLDNSPVGLAIVSSETRERIFTNRQLVKMFGGTSTDDLQARRIRDSWVDPERYLEAEKLLEAGKNLVNFRAERYRLDGSKWWAMMNSHFMVFDGIPARAVWHSDITEMVEARSAIEKINNDLEERVQIRTRELQETKERFRGYAEIASDWFWEMDSELRYTFISGAYQKYTGRPPERIIGRSRREMYKGQFPEERDTWMAFLDTLDAHRDFENFTYSYKRDDGAIRLLSNSGRAIFSEDGIFTGYRGVGIDITEQHTLQTLLYEQQAQLLAFTENSPSPVTIVDAEGRYTLVNKILLKNQGKTRDQILGRKADEIFPPNVAKNLTRQFNAVLASGEAQQFEFDVADFSGTVRTFLTERFPIYSTDGKLLGVGGVNTDITERKKIEEALLDSETSFQMIVDMQSELITRFTPDWVLTFVNRAYCEFVNASEEELLGTSMFVGVPEEETDRLIRYFRAFTAETALQKNENLLQRHDGAYRDFEWSNLAQFDANGEILGYQSVGRDVTEQRKIQKEIIEANEKAQEANRAKSSFLSTMSHEIRTPLNGVLGLAQMLMDTDLGTEQRKSIEIILSSGQTLLAILNDVLDMSKIEAGELQLEETVFRMSELVSMVSLPFRSLVDEKGLYLDVTDHLDPDLAVRGDPVRLRQILWNLLSNAIKFTEKGEVRLTVSQVDETGGKSADCGDLFLVFSVRDTGVGIRPDRQDAIFDAFTQQDSSVTRKYGGTGLGLSIVRQLTELMGGTISVSSQPQQGSEFTVTLPFRLESLVETVPQPLPDDSSSAPDRQSLNVLLVEDNPVNAMIAKSFLEKLGHQVEHAENGSIAIGMAQKGWADLILMDVHMPVMDGIEATQVIRASDQTRHVPIIGLTAEAFNDRHAHFRSIGMNDVLTKPYTIQQLASKLAEYPPVRAPADKPEPGASGLEEGDPVASSGLPQPAIGDDPGFDSLHQQLNPEIIATLLEQAEQSLLVRMRELAEGVAASDTKKIREAAHSIKGSSGSLFASRMSALAADMEMKSADTDARRTLLAEMQAAQVETLYWWHSKQVPPRSPAPQ